MSFVTTRHPRRSPWLLQTLAACFGGLVLFFMGASAISSGYQLLFPNRILPGISVAGVDLSSLTPEQATNALNQRLTYPTSGRVVFRDGERVWVATPAELGLTMDTGTSVQQAFSLGREGSLLTNLTNQLDAWQGGLYLEPIILFDARIAHAYLQNIAAQINQPVVEADLQLNGTDVTYSPGHNGRILNVDKALTALSAQLRSFRDGEIPLVIEEQAPLVADASTQADTLRKIVNGSLILQIPEGQTVDAGPWSIDQTYLAGMVSVGRVKGDNGWQYQISIDKKAIEQFLGQIAPKVDRSAKNARFWFDDNTGQLVLQEGATIGRTLDIPASQDAIVAGLMNGEHTISLAINLDQPAVGDNATAASLGITGLVQSYTSYFRGSSSARMQNIQAAAARFYGLLVPPNTTFSMGEAIGDISLDNGYAEALIIYNGQTITGVGGGVCQVSTTLFRTALFGGYPIVERHEHAYRVYYYEQTSQVGVTDPNLAGLDATVYFPLVDLKFTNDRPYWLLMETYFDPEKSSLTWKFYSGDDGRKVDVENLGLRNVVPAPDPLFVENTDLAPETCKQVDWPGDGADITVTRSVTKGGATLFTDTIKTHYQPWQAVYQYGPGTNDPQGLAAEGACH